MFRVLLVLCVLSAGWILANAPTTPPPSPSAMELFASDPGTEHHGTHSHQSCDINCFGCGHSVHDMCPSTLLLRGGLQQQIAIQRAPVTVRQGYRHALLRPPIGTAPSLA